MYCARTTVALGYDKVVSYLIPLDLIAVVVEHLAVTIKMTGQTGDEVCKVMVVGMDNNV